MISITIHPIDTAGKYEARLDGRLLCTSHTPFFSAARLLVARGKDPGETLAMYRADKAEPDLTGKLGEVAKLENRRRPLAATPARKPARRTHDDLATPDGATWQRVQAGVAADNAAAA